MFEDALRYFEEYLVYLALFVVTFSEMTRGWKEKSLGKRALAITNNLWVGVLVLLPEYNDPGGMNQFSTIIATIIWLGVGYLLYRLNRSDDDAAMSPWVFWSLALCAFFATLF